MTDIAVLNRAEQIALDDCEQRIERGLKTFIEVGQALAAIRDSRLYRASHKTFEDYAVERWHLKRAHAYRMIAAAEVVSPMGDIEVPPTSERQVRELAKVPEPERAEVWRETVERTNGKPTAAAVRAVQEERTQSPGPVGAVAVPPAGPGIDDRPAESAAPAAAGGTGEDMTPPPGSPATWGPEQREANRLQVERINSIKRGREMANVLVREIRGQILEVIGAVDLGERGLVTAQMVADIRASVDLLETRIGDAA